MTLALGIGAAISLGALALTLLNLATWARPRADRGGPGPMQVSMLIPARNEGRNIDATLAAARKAGASVHEIIVLDDHSTDDTAQRVLAAQAEDARIVLREGRPLRDGWVGKVHACHQLAEAADPTSDVLLFVDADTRIAPGAADAIGAMLAPGESGPAACDVLTAVPRQEVGGFAERLVLPLLHLTYVSWLPLALVPRTRNPAVLAANGQILALRPADLAAIGGFAAVRDAIVDDMALTRRAKASGLRVLFADGHHLAACRMYRGAGEVWRGFSKNFYPGLGSVPLLLVVLALHVLAWVLPFVALPIALVHPGAAAWAVPAGVAVLAAGLQRAILAVRHGHPIEGIVLHPFAVLGLVAIGVNSWWWTRTGRLVWAGRTYPSTRRAHADDAPVAPSPAES